MATAKRYSENPILRPNKNNGWEAAEVFNGCPIKEGKRTHLLYRATSVKKHTVDVDISASSVGYCFSDDGKNFKGRTQLIQPRFDWEKYGCEDPRVTKLGGKYYIFYTALSRYPFDADGIKVGVAVTKDFKTIEKHSVTTFNAKAMSLFPKKINGKIVGILTANTDRPPSKISLAYFDKESDIWSKQYWNNWYDNINKYALDFKKNPNDHIELGAPPISIPEGWLVIYSYITNYFNSKNPIFGIRAALLDKNNPYKILGQMSTDLLTPEETYEIYGKVPNIVFPSGAFIDKGELHIYYGAADTTCAAVKFRLKDVVRDVLTTPANKFGLVRYKKNPIITPIKQNVWEAKATFNPGAIYEDNKFHIIYRAMSEKGESTLGHATSRDGLNIDYRSKTPIYVPRENFEKRAEPGNSGCEDPRLVKIGSTIYMFYTAYNGYQQPSVALTTIKHADFVAKKWNWTKPILISPVNRFNKNACIFPEKINGKYIVLHRLHNSIDLHHIDNLHFSSCELCEENNWMMPRRNSWDSEKIGISGQPVKTKYGWLLIYHGVSRFDHHYRLGAVLLDLKNPEKIIGRTENPILEPLMPYEQQGQVTDVVFSCGTIIKKDIVYVYYGGGDTTCGVATIPLKDLAEEIKRSIY